MTLVLPNPKLVREAIMGIPDKDFLMPSPSAKFPNGVRRVPGKLVRIADCLALLGGFRISELVTKYSKTDGNTSETLRVFTDVHNGTGEEVLRVQVQALKKKVPVLRDIGVPLSSKYEPFSKIVLDAWNEAGEGNPCRVTRQSAWYVNRLSFAGMGYRVSAQIAYERDDKARLIRNGDGVPIVRKRYPEHIQPASNHFLRHIRAIELRDLQLTPEERVSFFKWSARGVGLNPMLITYSQPEWFEYFPKLLRRNW